MFASLASVSGSFVYPPSSSPRNERTNRVPTRRTNFTYAGPRKLSDILKPELLVDKSSSEIVSDIFCMCFFARGRSASSILAFYDFDPRPGVH